MFIEIFDRITNQNINVNSNVIHTYKEQDREDKEGNIHYLIVYRLINNIIVEEEFQTPEERNTKLLIIDENATIIPQPTEHTHTLDEENSDREYPETKTTDYCYELVGTCTIDGCDSVVRKQVAHNYFIESSSVVGNVYRCSECGHSYEEEFI